MIFFSAKTNGFYRDEIHDVMPDDVIKITEEYYQSLFRAQESGKMITSDKKGYPIIIEMEQPEENIIESNRWLKKSLIEEANNKIDILQDAIDLDMQEGNEEVQLKEWKKYRILLTRIDTSNIDVVFPEKPK